MSKLKRFSKNNRKRNTIKLIVAFLLVSVVSASISYAVYQKTDEIQFINAKVGSFDTSNSDIELAMTLDGEDIDVPPKKDDGYYNVVVECDHANGVWDKDIWGANIYNISSKRVKCNVNFKTLETLPLSIVEVGDYISMTPTSTSYTIPTSLTGYSSNQTINPSELNLWRVIKKNEDGTVDVVSEYTSSKDVYIYGQTGYLNAVGTLNTIAAQYTNSNYVSKTRHIGYSNQILKCSSQLLYKNSGNCVTDMGYESDLQLVNVAYGGYPCCTANCSGLKAYIAHTSTLAIYWLASRKINIDDTHWYYTIRVINDGGSLLNSNGLYNAHSDGGLYPFEGKYKVRPIITMKSTSVIKSGSGTKKLPYVLK